MNYRLFAPCLGTVGLAVLLTTAPQDLIGQDRPAARDLARQLNQAFIEVAENVSPAVVVIRVAHDPSSVEMDEEQMEMLPREFRRWLEEYRERQRGEKDSEDGNQRPNPHRGPVWDGQGSGVVIREEGYIVSNRHVVEGAKKIKVRFKDQSEFDAEVRGVDAQSDLAVLKIDPGSRKLAVAKFADSDKTRVGEFAIAIGAPFDLDYSVTFGHVSAKGRSRIIPDERMDQDFIQTDANINPGNSGGPLVNIDGEIIGVNTLIRGMRTGIGFAIPSNLVREVSERLISEGRFVRAYLGVKIRALRENRDFQEQVPAIEDGVVVQEIVKGGPAIKSDLKAGDVITAVEGKPVSTPQQLKNEIRGKSFDVALTLDVHRFGQNLKVKLKPEPWPEDAPMLVGDKPARTPDDRISGLGLTLQAKTKEVAREYGLEKEKTEGVVVTDVARGSPAASTNIKPGDLITDVNQKHVTSLKQFQEALKGANLKKGVVINYISEGNRKMENLKDSGD